MTFINKNDLKSGDVLLGYLSSARDKGNDELNSGYIHAAIYLGEDKVAEAVVKKVQITSFEHAIEDYNHIAVLRQPDAWHKKNVAKLNFFVQELIDNKAKFNRNGLGNFKNNLHSKSILEQDNLEKYFDGQYQPKSPVKEQYFCSELVVSAYIAVGFISESAAIIYNPETISPSALGDDPTFGIFLGYIKPYDEYIIPENDQFIHCTPYHKIYGL